MASNCGNFVAGGACCGEPVDPPYLLWTVYAYGPDDFTRERTVPCNFNVKGYPFPPNTQVPSIQEHEDLVWLVGNLKLKVTNYSRTLYGPRGAAYPGNGGDDNDDDDGGGEEEDLEVTLSYQPRKRQHQ